MQLVVEEFGVIDDHALVTSDTAVLGPILYVERISAWFATQIANHTIQWAIVLAAVVIGSRGPPQGHRTQANPPETLTAEA